MRIHEKVVVKPRIKKKARTSAVNDDLVALLKQLVEIDSATSNITGVNLIQKILATHLEGMGFQVQFKKNLAHESGDLLLATLEGERKDRFVTFVSHADTVLHKNQVSDGFSVSADRRKISGSGVIDNKGGVVVLLEGLKRFIKRRKDLGKKPLYSLRIVISPNEEAGSPGFNESFRAFANDSDLVLGFEPALENGAVIKSRRGNRWYQITVEGIEGHAGRSRGEHINAAHELAFKITKMHKLTDFKKGISVNVGAIQGGRDKFNVICGHAEAKVDTRFSSFETRDRLHRKIEKILKTRKVVTADGEKTAQVSYTLHDDCPPFASNLRSRKLVKRYLDAIQSVEGEKPEALHAGGAGDVNYMSGPNVVIIDGLGPMGGKMHTVHEYLETDSLETRSEALARFLFDLR